MTKTCSRCGETKPVSDFQKRSVNKDGFAGMCKPCKRAYDNKHYAENPRRRSYIRKNSEKRVTEIRHQVLEYLKENPCVDCGNEDVRVLEFDHRENKTADISRMMTANSVEKVFQEISKCDVRCANCHRIKTVESLGWWRSPARLV